MAVPRYMSPPWHLVGVLNLRQPNEGLRISLYLSLYGLQDYESLVLVLSSNYDEMKQGMSG